MIKLEDKIRSEKEVPIIGIIGSTSPINPYTRNMGVDVGYELRKYLNDKKGTLFTGGVNGVGVDVYTGVLKYCIENYGKRVLPFKKNIPDDRFFVLVPEEMEMPLFHGIFKEENIHESSFTKVIYEPPEAYTALAALSSKHKLDIIRAGENMNKRRKYVAKVADALVVVNGGYGTLDEALSLLLEGKPLITLPYSGGAAKELLDIKERKIPIAKSHRLPLDKLDLNLINIAHDTSELISNLISFE